MAHASRKMFKFLAFCALVATSQSGHILSMPDNLSLEDSRESGSESIESTDYTLSSVHGVKNPSYGVAVSGGRPATLGADAAVSGGIPATPGADAAVSRGIPATPGADAAVSGGIPATLGGDTEGIFSRFGGGGDSFNSDPTTEIPSTTTELSQTVTRDRAKSPVFNIWEYAKVAGPVHVRTGGSPNDVQQTSTSGLTRCEWAIISCCQSTQRSRRNSCFDALHCGGAWFENPCTDRLQMAVYGRLLEVGPF